MPKIEKHKVEERSTSFNMKLLENIKIQCNCQPRTSSEKKCGFQKLELLQFQIIF